MTTFNLSSDICEIILKYIQKPKYELLEWINIDDLDFSYLSTNHNAIEILKENKDKINWYGFSQNPSIFKLI